MIEITKSALPQRALDALFHFAFHVNPERFRKFSFEYAHAPDMLLGLEAISRRGLKPDLIVDVGAYVGSWSRMANKIWPMSNIIMIEVNYEKESVLREISDQLGAELHIALLGSEEGKEVKFHLMESGSSVLKEKSPLPYRVKSEKLVKLDSIIKNRQIDILKIDAQGYEIEIMRGAPEVMKSVSAIIIEVSLIQTNNDAPLIAEVFEFMRNNKMVAYEVLEIHRRPLDGAMNQIDIMFLRDTSNLLANTSHF